MTILPLQSEAVIKRLRLHNSSSVVVNETIIVPSLNCNELLEGEVRPT
jgi:hypothetical protein